MTLNKNLTTENEVIKIQKKIEVKFDE